MKCSSDAWIEVVKIGVVYRTDLGSLLSSLEPKPKSIQITIRKGDYTTELQDPTTMQLKQRYRHGYID